jgi:DNA-binding response OmpR family regulator
MQTPAVSDHRVLIVDDDPGVRSLLTALLRDRYRVEVAVDGEEATYVLRQDPFCAVLLDLMLPKLNGFEVLRFVAAERPQLMSRIIVVTAVSDTTLRDFDSSKVRRLIRKPFDINDLVETVAACADQDNGNHWH